MNKAIFFPILLCASQVFAANQAKVPSDHHRIEPFGRVVGLSAPAPLNATVRFVLPKAMASGYSTMILHVWYTHANNGALTMTCKSIDNANGSQREYELTTCQVVVGTCNLQFGGVYVTPSLSADRYFTIPVGLRGYHDMACTFTHGGTPTASDTLVVDGYLVTE